MNKTKRLTFDQDNFLGRLYEFFKWNCEKSELDDYETIKDDLHTEFKSVLNID